MPENKKNEMAGYTEELAKKVEEKNMELRGVYAVNGESYRRFASAYAAAKKFALLNDGGISGISMEPDAEFASISIEAPSVELYREGMELFGELLELVDAVDVSGVRGEYLKLKVGVKGLWEAAAIE